MNSTNRWPFSCGFRTDSCATRVEWLSQWNQRTAGPLRAWNGQLHGQNCTEQQVLQLCRGNKRLIVIRPDVLSIDQQRTRDYQATWLLRICWIRKKRWASLDHVIRPEFSTKSSFDCVSSEFCHAKNVFKLLNLHSNRLLIISAIEWKLFRHFSTHSSAARGLKRKWLWICWSTALFFPDFDGGYLGRIQLDSFRNCFNVLCTLSSIEWSAKRIRLTKQQPANAVWIRTLVTAEGNLNQLMEIESDLTRYATNRLPVSVGSPDRQVSVWTMNFSPAIDRFVKWPLASRDNVHQIIRLRRRQRHSHRISRRRTN